MTNDKEPFQVVLIDLRKAANLEIHCVKKSLTEELNYVAISYRWGELQETVIDTRVGYLASITSFDIQDFFRLCASMIKERTMASMEYVWVDAICVNQSNHDQRKATIYHMSEIYERATWILAVPDLHTAHLRASSSLYQQVMSLIQEHRLYLYHLLHGNSNRLGQMDKCDYVDRPFKNIYPRDRQQYDDKEWQKVVTKRNAEIPQAIQFLMDLVVDWSSRVWVISEFHISKNKSNLKFWFTQLHVSKPTITFFKNDTDYYKLKTLQNTNASVCLIFYERLNNQLDRQTFLEMMLKSKASKNEDRFYSIFPLFTKYKDLLQSNKGLVANVNSILAVKLKLYQVMTTKDKALLLYLSANGRMTWTLPTFATSVVFWPDRCYDLPSMRFKESSITLCYEKTMAGGRYYLLVKPKQYRLSILSRCWPSGFTRTLDQLQPHKLKTLIEEDSSLCFDVIQVFEPLEIWLIGSVDYNIWILGTKDAFFVGPYFGDIQVLPEDSLGFRVY